MYRENNINFRIASACAISDFKSAQAHAFLQVCRKEFDFNLSSREVVLLSYDRLSKWIMNLEKDFVMEEGVDLPTTLQQSTLLSIMSEFEKIESICMDNQHVFTPQIIQFLKIIHSYSQPIIFEELGKAMKNNPARAFVAVANLLSEYLQHVLISMHEFNNNVILGKDPFICISPFCLPKTSAKFVALQTRAAYFKSVTQEDCDFLLKNYTSVDVTEQTINTLSSMGIKAHHENLEITA